MRRFSTKAVLALALVLTLLVGLCAPAFAAEPQVSRQTLTVDGFAGEMEVDTNQDVKAEIIALTGSLALNQISAVSRLTVPGDFVFTARKRGVGNALFFEQAGQRTEDFSTPDAETLIELNGMKSELYICRK